MSINLQTDKFARPVQPAGVSDPVGFKDVERA